MLSFLINNQNYIEFVFLLTGVVISGVLFYVSIISILEKEYRAFRVSFILSSVIIIPFLIIFFFDFQYKIVVISIIILLIFITLIVLFFPYRPKLKEGFQIPKDKHDERDIMFSRNELKPETEKYDSYYHKNPEKKELDDKFKDKNRFIIYSIVLLFFVLPILILVLNQLFNWF